MSSLETEKFHHIILRTYVHAFWKNVGVTYSNVLSANLWHGKRSLVIVKACVYPWHGTV